MGAAESGCLAANSRILIGIFLFLKDSVPSIYFPIETRFTQGLNQRYRYDRSESVVVEAEKG